MFLFLIVIERIEFFFKLLIFKPKQQQNKKLLFLFMLLHLTSFHLILFLKLQLTI